MNIHDCIYILHKKIAKVQLNEISRFRFYLDNFFLCLTVNFVVIIIVLKTKKYYLIAYNNNYSGRNQNKII